MTRDEEMAHLMKGWEPKEVTYKRWGWTPQQIAHYEKHGDWHEANMFGNKPIELPKIPLQVSKLRWVDGKATFEHVPSPVLTDSTGRPLK